MLDWIVSVMNAGGYAGIAFLMALENIFPPIPSEVIMPLAGYLVQQKKLALWLVVLAATVGSTAGNFVLFEIGRRLGEERLKKWAEKHGRWVALSPEDIDKGNDWFTKHGAVAVFFCRLVPGLRSLISIPAGINKMNVGTYLLATALGSALWCGVLAYIGYRLGSRFEEIEKFLEPASRIVFGALFAFYIFKVITGGKKRKGDDKDEEKSGEAKEAAQVGAK